MPIKYDIQKFVEDNTFLRMPSRITARTPEHKIRGANNYPDYINTHSRFFNPRRHPDPRHN